MTSSLVYLAGPIYEMDDTCIRWRKGAQLLLRKKGIMSISPTDADYRGKESIAGIATQVVERDKRDILSCDTIIAKCDMPSYGTAMEILFAWSMHKQIVVVTNTKSPWITYHATKIVSTIEDAVGLLEYPSFDPGPSK